MNYYDELPDGYVEKLSIDAGNKKWGLLFNGLALLIGTAILIPMWFLKGFSLSEMLKNPIELLITDIVFFISLFGYIILHELIHGLFYKIFTHKKLTFGLKLTCAYCGVPEIYSKKIPMIITTLAPFVIFNALLLPWMIVLPGNVECFAITFIFAMHFSGCVGDLFVAVLLLKYPKDVLINDQGAKQTFYIKEEVKPSNE